MQPLSHNRESYDFIDVVLFVLLAAVLCAIACTLFTANSLLVLIFAVVSILICVLLLVRVTYKLDRYQQEIAALSSHVDTTEAERTAVMEELQGKKEELATTIQQRDDATAKTKTLTKASKQQKKDINALNATNDIFCGLNIESNDNINGAKTSLDKEKADHIATKGLLHRAEEDNVALAESVAGANKERDSKNDQLEHVAFEYCMLIQRYAVLEEQLAAANGELNVSGAELDEEKEKTVDLTQRLASSTKLRIIANTKLKEHKLENGVLVQRLGTYHAELAVASEKLAAKNVVIAELRFKTGQGLLVAMDHGKENAILSLSLKKSLGELEVFRFHAELDLRAAAIAKATVTRLQNKVNELRWAMVSLQPPPSTPSHAHAAAAAATSTKHDATAAIPNDSSTGTVSATLSPTGSGSTSFSGSGSSSSSSISRTNSGISTNTNTSNSGGNGVAQSVVSAPPMPAMHSPSNIGASPAVTHTGPHNKPKRVNRAKRGQKHDGKTRSGANETARMRAGLDRGYS